MSPRKPMATPVAPADEHAGASAGVQSIQRAMAVLRLVACGMEQGVRISDIAAMSGLSHSTVHRLLKVLVQESAVEQDPQTRRYRIGPEMSLLGLARTNRFPIKTIAQPYLHALVEQIGDVAFLSVRHGADSVCIGRTLGHHAIQVLSIEEGARRPLGASVSGVVLLAGMEQDLSERITQSNAVRLERSGFLASTVLDKVRAARQAGFVYAQDGVMPGTSAVAVPVRDPRGQVVAAISVAALNTRLDRKRMPAVRSCMLEQSSMITRRLAQLEKARPRQA
ncbi:IclR family transcriptional regulator [Comamonadaceae bacterium G21597-S1]|nr:IclR family transcriptional regulator [Comamonadaceae bacterium G21597-S1]